jgi:YHS domain-containing protein
MNHRVCAFLLAAAFSTGWTLALAAEDKEKKPVQPVNCPVTGKPANLLISVATDDGPVFFCSDACIDAYKKDPAKYAAKVAEQRKTLADRPKVQVTCPVSGNPVDKKVFIEQDGQKVYFCCKDCIDKFKADTAKYKAKLANSYSYQLKCPVMGGDIDPASFMDLTNGWRVYFCCPNCAGPLTKEPDKYLPKLADQGILVDAKTFPKLTKDKEAKKE